MIKYRTVILGVTGSIAAYKACDIISALKKNSFDVKVVLTEEAEKFITPLTIQTISGNKAMTDMFTIPDEWEPIHTSLADKAAAVLIAPATAGIIGKIASGICDCLLTCVVYATKAPVLIAPAMNTNMYHHRITQANIAKLKSIGYEFIGPAKGRLACGIFGDGCLAGVADIVTAVKRRAK